MTGTLFLLLLYSKNEIPGFLLFSLSNGICWTKPRPRRRPSLHPSSQPRCVRGKHRGSHAVTNQCIYYSRRDLGVIHE